MATGGIDKVRASRDGHQYHEAWLARRALGLLLPRDSLCGIAVEGLSVEDQEGASSATVEIADATFYFGEAPTFDDATHVEIAQFKYSTAKERVQFLASDAVKTITKFAQTEADLLKNPSQLKIIDKISYTIYTNRPIGSELLNALSFLVNGELPSGQRNRAQYEMLLATIPLRSEQLQKFAARIFLVGGGGDLQTIEKGNARIIADWSASKDALARARLGDLRELVRNKAGLVCQRNNVITYIDVLAVLGIADESDLLPAPHAFLEPGPVIEREQLQNFIDYLGTSNLWLIHAAGGVGKTVFVQSVASRLSANDEVVLFDCFGGGRYRSPLDMRHRSDRGLLHIVNELACRGLCDPLLPGASDPTAIVRHCIHRFSQSIVVVRRTRPEARLVLIIDAADNAAMEARDKGQNPFPQLLLESLSSMSPCIDGLVCILTARSERRELAIGRSQCKDFVLRTFSTGESQAFIEKRRPEATPAQIEAIHRRSNGNPRVIANLIESDRSLAGVDSIASDINLNDLIDQRIKNAIRLADNKGCTRNEVSAFLCALSILPPPVPIDEMATAFGISYSEIESFAADISPLLERTRHGLIFRDEPTETLVRQTYGQQLSLLDGVVSRLGEAQSSSVYAARSLPGMLFTMGKIDQLRALAFDMRFPSKLDSDLAKRTIRLNRLRMALGAASKKKDFSATVELLVELAALVIVDERGEDYLLEQPDLVVGLSDSEAFRRLFEARTAWPGTRHSRLAIAYVADGDTAEAYGHVVRADDWLRWLDTQDGETRRTSNPDQVDYASIAFYLFAKEKFQDVAEYIAFWKPFYGFSIASQLFEYCVSTESFGALPNFRESLNKILTLPKLPPALLVAALNVLPSVGSPFKIKRALKRIAVVQIDGEQFSAGYNGNRYGDTYRKALIRCAIRMANLGMAKEVNQTLLVTVPQRYRMWLLHEAWNVDKLVSFALTIAARCAVEYRVPDFFDCLPQELWSLVEDASRPLTDEDQRRLLAERLKELEKTSSTASIEVEGRRKKSSLLRSELSHVSDRISYGVVPLLTLVRQLANMIAAGTAHQAKAATAEFFKEWKSLQVNDSQKRIYVSREYMHFVNDLYKVCAAEIFMALNFLTLTEAEDLIDCLENCQMLAPATLIHFIRLLAAREDCQTQVGKLAVLAVRLIENEKEVKYRSQMFAHLSRALLQVSRSESSLLFKRGLNELSAIGSGDDEFASEVLHFATTIENGMLSSQLALRLAKICEINVYDSDKWSWALTAGAFARVSGISYLAQIARWHDRDKADLNLTLPSALTCLVKEGVLNPALAVSLLWLVNPQPLWGWGWHNLLKVLTELNVNEPILLEVLDQYEHSTLGRPSSRDINEIIKELKTSLRPTRFDERLRILKQQCVEPRKIKTEVFSQISPLRSCQDKDKEKAKFKEILGEAIRNIDPNDSKSLEDFFEKLRLLPSWSYDKAEIYSGLRDRVSYADREKHLEAIVVVDSLSLYEKISILKGSKDEWIKDSPSSLAFLSKIGSRLICEHAEEMLGRKSGVTASIFNLSEITNIPVHEIAMVLVEEATIRELNAPAMTWLSIATILSKQADEVIPLRALERMLNSGSARLADEIGDGPWCSELDPGMDPNEIAAGLLWFVLGSPTTNLRWRAAHAVRSVANNGQWSVIEQMFELFDKDDAGAFQDRSLPFFKYHAHLWFLLAIARIALDFPKEIGRFRPKLEAIAFQNLFPHIGIREAACEALKRCFARKRDVDSKKLVLKIGKVNVSQFPLAKTRDKNVRNIYRKRPANMPRPEPCFHFDYDFEKYNVDDLARVFGISKWRIKDLIRYWIQKWAPGVSSTYEFSGRKAPYRRQGYYLATDKAHQSHGAYLAWHALAVVSGQLLLKRLVTNTSYHDNPWQDWLNGYRITRKDGYWISDGTGNYPLVAMHDLRSSDGSKVQDKRPIHNNKFLTMLVGLGEPSKEEIIVQAWWNSPDGVECSVMSALVDPENVELTAQAVVTSPPFQMWLPHQDFDDDESTYFRRHGREPCESWIMNLQQSENLDDRDPFGASSALSIYQPIRSVVSRFKLTPTKPWSHAWIEEDGAIAFRYNGWGGWKGYGEAEERHNGHALYCNRTFLAKLLAELNRDLIILVKLQKYHESKKDSTGKEIDSHFTHSFIVISLDNRLKARVIEPTSEQLDAVSKLGERDIYEFANRFLVLKRLKYQT